MPDADAVAAAYRTINEADPATADALEKLRGLYAELGDSEAGETAIEGILSSGPGAAGRLVGTYHAVRRANKLPSEE